MINGQKVIGVCITKINDATRTDYMNRLHHLARRAGYKLLVFNSFVDFYRNDSFDMGSRAVYQLIDYSIIDVLLVVCDTFKGSAVVDGIISSARENGAPVILVNGTAEGCACITADYRDSYKQVLRHIIKEHGITDTFYIAGNRENDGNSVVRIECYKEVLEENGIPFDESRVGYGGYWEDPTKRIMNELLSDGKRPPRAILCANDHMAFTVCKELNAAGYNVPDDVVVTGFDGVPASQYFVPRITTCRENIEEIAVLSVEAVKAVLAGDTAARFTHKYVPMISESCGCNKLGEEDFRSVASELYQSLHDMEMHEDFEYSWIDRVLDIRDMNSLYSTLSGCMLENSYACLNSDFIRDIMDIDHVKEHRLFSDELIVIGSQYSKGETERTSKLQLSELVPYSEVWGRDDASYILNSIYVGSEVVGYYAVRTDSFIYSSRKMKRVLKTINIAFNVAMNYFRQQRMSQRMESAELINSVTKLPNLKGCVKWFEEFSASEENLRRSLSISVYGLPKYTYIYENYGVEAIEEALCLVAESLKMANPVNCFIGHIAEDEYVVINYYDDPSEIGTTIEKATSVFFSLIEGYNTDSGKEYYVEVNCGCTVVNSHWTGSLEGFIKFANSEMYMNRLKNGAGSAVKESAAPKEHYKTFDLLIEKNLFAYHFQPIVSAKTGEVYAYEALMRTDSSIGMNPLQVLDAAKEYNRLYEIERATMFNIMERFAADSGSFGDAKVFINTIPGYFLKGEDIEELSDRYGAYMNRFVFELTEQNTVSDEELNTIRSLSGRADLNQIAIDDYGTGHSNIVNLMRYAPQIIKIDRFLITDIHRDQNKQMFVRSTVEFAKLNGIRVLAEGVETSNELRTVIDLGVDLIQGYYTGKPAPQPIPEIAADIKMEIIVANPLFGQER